MADSAEHLRTGAAGEEAAAAYVRGLGWRVAERNWRPAGARRGLELDIVARDGGVLVFIEVKSRRRQAVATEAGGIPVYAAFTPQKRQRLLRAARLYLAARDLWRLPCRFDFIAVELLDNGRHKVEHQRHVIELGHIADSGHAPWQPW